MGAKITQEHGYLEARAERLKGAHILFDKITVTGTEDLLMAAVLADGETVMENCAREPEVTDLAAMLDVHGGKNRGRRIKRDSRAGCRQDYMGRVTASIRTELKPVHFSLQVQSREAIFA